MPRRCASRLIRRNSSGRDGVTWAWIPGHSAPHCRIVAPCFAALSSHASGRSYSTLPVMNWLCQSSGHVFTGVAISPMVIRVVRSIRVGSSQMRRRSTTSSSPGITSMHFREATGVQCRSLSANQINPPSSSPSHQSGRKCDVIGLRAPEFDGVRSPCAASSGQ